MNTATLALPCARPAPARLLGALLVAEALLSFAPLAVLAPAIGWPASLGRPAADQLAAVAAAPDEVRLGYGLYLLYSLLVAPVMFALAARVGGGMASPWASAAALFGALSALARAIGILRWLAPMPLLATAHAQGDATTRAVIERVFEAVHAWGGAVGEWLGVGLFMAASVAALSVAALRARGWPRGLSYAGFVVAALLASLASPAFGLSVAAPVAVAVSALSAWMLAAGVWLLRGR